MGLVSDCERLFGTKELYDVLAVPKGTRCQTKLKKAYYGQSMKWHPDRWSGEEDEEKQKTATERFQALSAVYEILKDREKKAVYDETGAVDDENVLSEEDLVAAWRKMFKKVTEEDIQEYLDKYRGSAEERKDILAAYARFAGDMTAILEHVIGADDEERVGDVIREAIAKGELEETAAFKKTTKKKAVAKRKSKAVKEAAEAEEMLKEIKKREGEGDLRALILKRQGDRGNAFDAIAAKYSQPPKKKSKK